MTTTGVELQVIPEKELSCEVLVVGMGFAGPVAAVRAAERGAKVLVIDKQPRAWWTPGGIMMIHAELHLAFRPLDAPQDDLRQGLLDCTDGYIPRDLLDVTVGNSHRAYEWLTSHGGKFDGIRFEPQGPNRVWGRIKPGGIYDLEHTGLKQLTVSLESQLKEKGGEILYETKALRFTTDARGAVTGLIARDADGQFNIRAKSIIMCTGGYDMNNEMMVKYLGPRGDEIIHWSGPWATGDGFRMCDEVGAAMRSMNHAAFSHYFSTDCYLNADVLGAYLDQPAANGIIVDRDGQRFVDETLGPRVVGPIMTKTSIYKTGWIVFDGSVAEIPTVKTRIDDMNEFGGTMHVADTLEAAGKLAGIGPRLSRTVADYNAGIAAGTAAEMVVPRAANLNPLTRGPFYAIPFVPGIVATYGGVMVNGSAQVLDWDKKPIPNLYAAGLSMIGSVCGGTENSAGAYTGFQAVGLIFALLAAESVTAH